MKKHTSKKQTTRKGTAKETFAFYIGIDLGDKKSDICVLDEQGELDGQFRLRMNAQELQTYFGSLARSRVAMEAGAQSRWVAEVIERCGHQVYVSNTRQVPYIHQSDAKNGSRRCLQAGGVGALPAAAAASHPTPQPGGASGSVLDTGAGSAGGKPDTNHQCDSRHEQSVWRAAAEVLDDEQLFVFDGGKIGGDLAAACQKEAIAHFHDVGFVHRRNFFAA